MRGDLSSALPQVPGVCSADSRGGAEAVGSVAVEIALEGIRVEMRIGVEAEERMRPRPIIVDVKFQNDFPDGGDLDQLDQLDHTVDYGEVHRIVVARASSREFHLVETFALCVYRDISARFPRMRKLEVVCRKPSPPVQGSVDAALIRIPAGGHS